MQISLKLIMSSIVSQPLDFVKLLLDCSVYIKLKGNREILGKLEGFDQHCNMILSNAEETITSLVDNQTTTTKNKSPMMFIRGDGIVLVSGKQ